jgi:DNA repair protein RecN (Recombination protein N)
VLETLSIRNIAVIDAAEIPFKAGLNILSGETGAGKSIIIEAISLILGSRANTDLIRAGADEATVEGLFDISRLPWMKERLERFGLHGTGAGELLVKRVVHRGGKHRVYVNGGLATLTILHDLCDGLVDLCGQHEHQSLVRPATQLDLLDRFGGLEKQALAFAEAHARYRGLCRERDELAGAEAERARRSDFLQFQIAELADAKLEAGEDERLQAEKQLLQNAGTRVAAAEGAREALEGEDGGLLGGLRGAIAKLKGLGALDERVSPVREALERALAESEEASLALNRYLGSVDLDPQRLETVQERLARLAELRRKYGPDAAAMLGTLARLEAELAALGQASERLGALSSETEAALAELEKLGRKLSAARKKAAEGLAKAVTGELAELKMGEARFAVEIAARGEPAEWPAGGADTIQFVCQTNRGEAARPLSKVASGGELSRLMLAIRRVIADRGGIGVYLFDEIDAGIGGQTAFQVGRKLKSVAKHNQVLCITHLPQVASFADHHLSVRKSASGKRTVTEVVTLAARDRKEELARMLGGPQLTRKSLENAAELLEIAR